MDFDDTPEEAAFRVEARAWLDAHAIPKGHPDDFSAGMWSTDYSEEVYVKRCREWQGVLAGGGWAGITWPVVYGGRGGRAIEGAIFNQEQARFGVSNGVFAIAIGMVGPTLLAHGTEEQKRRFLPPMLRGDEVWCQLFSEPEAGSDLAAITTRAHRDGDEWVVTGQKVWTSAAHRAEWGILLARTDPDVPKHKGITYFVVAMDSPGIDIRPLRQMTGDAHFSEVFLDEVRIPSSQVLGEVGEGWNVARTTLASERSAIAGGSGGADPPGLIALAQQRGLADDPLVRQAVVEAHLRSELLRYLRLRSQTALSKGTRPGPEGSVMKLAYARFMQQMTATAMHLQGALGMLDEPSLLPRGGVWTTKFLHSPSLRIAGGSDQIQANIIGERVLGLPAEPPVGSAPMAAVDPLTKSQAARRQRVLLAALELGADGGYEAVQMRDVAASAEVALGTIYRYFPSKDALLAAAMLEWMEDLERRVTQRSPRGDSTSERVYDVLRRAVATMERQPKLAEAVITALTSDDREAGAASVTTTDVMQRVLITAFPAGTDPELEANIAKVLGHVWFSCLVAWSNGVGDLAWVGQELETATHLLCDHLS